MENLTEEFTEYIKFKKQSSDNTVLSYKHDLKAFSDYIELNRNSSGFDKIGEDDIKAYVLFMQKTGKSDSSIRRALVTIRSFYSFLLKKGEVSINPAEKVNVKINRSTLPEVLTPREIELILSQPDMMTLKGCRDRAIMEVLYATGMKATEIISLNVSDVSFATSTIHCGGEGCGSAVRTVPIYAEAAKCLKFYIERAGDAMLLTDALFVNLGGGRLTRQGFWKIIKQYAQKAGINKEISPDTIRRSFATQLLQNGADIKMVQEILGHSSPVSTQNYLKLAKNKFSDAYMRCHPRAF